MNRHSTIKVAVNGNPAFVWDGGEIEARKVLEVPDAARRLGHTPQQLADSLMFYLVRDGGKLLPNSDAGQGFQMTAVIWRILGAETNDAEHPGKIADYVGAVNFDIDIRPDPDDGGFTLVVEAKSKFDA